MHDVIILGAGPAGLSAALWCDELGLDTLVIEQAAEVGGQLLRVYNPIANYLGVAASSGRELRDIFAAQIMENDFDLWTEAEVESVELKTKRVRLRSGEELQSIALVIATGVRRRRLNVPGEAEFEGRGVFESATDEGAALSGRDVCVVGFGDAAAEDALLLTEICPTVTIVHRGERPAAHAGLAERVRTDHRANVFAEAEVTQIIGDESVRAVEIMRRGALKPFRMAVGGVLVSVGVEPNTELFRGQVEANARGFLKINGECETSVENVFAIGDVANPLARTVSTAAGGGASAAKVIAARLRGG